MKNTIRKKRRNEKRYFGPSGSIETYVGESGSPYSRKYVNRGMHWICKSCGNHGISSCIPVWCNECNFVCLLIPSC